jgi:hypothetical protein
MMFTVTGFAQNSPKWELYGDYSYLQFNPTINGLNSRALNGGGGGVQVNFGKYFGLKGDFQGYASTQVTFTQSVAVNPLGGGTIPVGTYKSSFNMFTYLFGPVVGAHSKNIYVYGEFLMGGSNTSGYGNLEKAIDAGGGTITVSATQHPFTWALGGGLDWRMNKAVALRLGEMDWLATRYTNPLTNTNNQHSFRYLGGIVFTFGE